MPEGDTIFRTARTLERALGGRVVTRFETVLPALGRVDEDAPIAGRTITGVRSIGKHLLIVFSGGLVLRTHMRMSGAWHIYRVGERWRRSKTAARIVIGTDVWVGVAFNVPVAEFVTEERLQRHAVLGALGPDLLAPVFDEAEARRRLRAAESLQVADALLDQRVMAGIGNVFKSEILFVCRVDPFRTAASLSADEVAALVRTARRLLCVNVIDPRDAPFAAGGHRRRTTRLANPAAALFVYDRAGRPCRQCGSLIEHRLQQPSARWTFWCPRCQV
jgi:endonuclease-8